MPHAGQKVLTFSAAAKSSRSRASRAGSVGAGLRGLDSIPVRFGLMAGALATICAVVQALIWSNDDVGAFPVAILAAIAATLVLAQASITVVAARKLTANINALRESTEAIASGDLDAPVDVDCACEVGGLADSFRKLVARLNGNLRRMNLLAHSDPLTGLPNRALVAHLIDRLAAARLQGSVYFIDLDGFGKINDAYGYRAGDLLLRQVGQRLVKVGLDRDLEQLDWGLDSFGELQDRPPSNVSFARFAADQFVALIPGAASVEACELNAKAMLRALDQPFVVAGVELKISARIGVARLPVDSSDSSEALKFADLAMAAARRRRADCVMFEPGLYDAAVEQSQIETDLREALARRELYLDYQPQVDSRSGELVGVEALVRWKHPMRGLLSPGVFLPIAERAGMMTALGNFVLDAAIRQCGVWQRAGAPKRIAINIAPAHLDDRRFADDVLALIATYQANPALIEIEITESTAMLDTETTRTHLHRLKEAGVRLAVDDFGVGYSNLSQLARLPFNALKLDKSLIDEIGRSDKGDAIAKMIINLGRDLGYTLIAEGVETAEQRTLLQQFGCAVHQGFLIARPMSVEALDHWEQRPTTETLRKLHAAMRTRAPATTRSVTPAALPDHTAVA
jgi:predicted signal transduction protein with EAL and GGDEF domain